MLETGQSACCLLYQILAAVYNVCASLNRSASYLFPPAREGNRDKKILFQVVTHGMFDRQGAQPVLGAGRDDRQCYGRYTRWW